MPDSSLAPRAPYRPPADYGLLVMYQDEDLLVLDKPAGLLAVSGRTPDLRDCLLTRLHGRLPGALLVHRLDEATSGLMAFALNPLTQRQLGQAFEAREVEKTYQAWVHGLVINDAGTLNTPIASDWDRRPLQRVDLVNGKPAVTHWQVLERDDTKQLSKLQLKPKTGRTHQLRVHMQAMGHSIVGDILYKPDVQAHLPINATGRLLLHATGLCFEHPRNRLLLQIRSPAPF